MSLGQLLQRAAQARQPQHHVIELQFRQTGGDQRERRKPRISPVEWCLIRSVAADLVAQADGLVEQAAVARKSILELSRKVEERRQDAHGCGCHDEVGAICDCQDGGERELGEFCCAMLLASVHFGRMMSFAQLSCPPLMDGQQRFSNVIGAPEGLRAEAYAASLAGAPPQPAAASWRQDPNASPFEALLSAMMRYAQGDRNDLPEAAPLEVPDEQASRPDAEQPPQDTRPRGRGHK